MRFFRNKNCANGFVLIMAMIFLSVFAALAVSMASMSTANIRLAKNQHDASLALSAAQSGLELTKYFLKNCDTQATSVELELGNSEIHAAWKSLCDLIIASPLVTVPANNDREFKDAGANGKTGKELVTSAVSYGQGDVTFTLRFYKYNQVIDPNVSFSVESTGTVGNLSQTVAMDLEVTRDNSVLKYAVASRGRIWLTSETIIDGDIYSSWDSTRYGSAGVETTLEVINNGTIGTINTIAELDGENIQMETLDSNGSPIFDEFGNRIYSDDDTVQGQHAGIEYDVSDDDLPGMDPEDYDTSGYRSQCTSNIPTASTVTEYFPHASGSYSTYKSGGIKFYRHKYTNETFTNAFLAKGRNALFENCTFNGVLYIETTSYTNRTSKCNNIRFDNCQFNGVIVTDIPMNSSIQWRQNCLYFTGGAIFSNQWSSQEATILAPNFNVNLGNTTELEVDQSSIIEGAVVGGIVDVRGNVEIDGTIISMYDTKSHPSGYVTNIGSTSDDGGSEGGAFAGEDIDISPSQEQLLPAGIQASIIISPIQQTYIERPKIVTK